MRLLKILKKVSISETEFSYIKNINNNEVKFFDKIIKNNISIDTLKKLFYIEFKK